VNRGWHPLHKTAFTKSYDRGVTPIAKNIKVIDSNGIQYEATYPKRAKGLVKNGRARFIDEHTICLACPPNTILEDEKMTDRINNKIEAVEQSETTDTTIKANPGSKTFENAPVLSKGNMTPEQTTNEATTLKKEPTSEKESSVKEDQTSTAEPQNPYQTLSMEWVASRFDAIQQDNDHIHEAFNAILSMGENAWNQARSAAIADVVKSRETTNQQLLQMLEKMYGDLQARENGNNTPFFMPAEDLPPLLKLAEDLPPEEKLRFLTEISQDEAWQPKATPNFSAPMQMSELKTLIEKLPTEQKQELLKSLGVERQDAHPGIERTLQNIKPLLDEIKSLDWKGMPEEVRGAIANQFSRNW
jgi:hypothetical protein